MASSGCKQTMFVGDRFHTARCGWVEVVKYCGKSLVTVRFDDTGETATGTTFEIRSGAITDRTIPVVYGVGFMGSGHVRGPHNAWAYSVWTGVLERCYDKAFQDRAPTYKDCSVAKDWLNFQNFSTDTKTMIKEPKWEIDKDILVKGNRVYSKETCVFLPKELNLLISTRDRNLPTGVYARGKKFVASCRVQGKQKHVGMFLSADLAFQAYKEVKESEIKRVSDIWKDRLDPRAYSALVGWKITIND